RLRGGLLTMASKQAYAYLRVSSTAQGGEDRHGFDRQLAAIERFAKGARINIVDTFRDTFTGTEADRPGFSAMIAALRSNGTRTVIIESLDRLARSLSVQIGLLALLEREGITLLSASTGPDVAAATRADPMREAMVMMQGVFAQTEKKLLVRKLRLAREAKAARGEHSVGAYRFGEHPERPHEAETLARLCELRRAKPGRRKPTLGELAAI